MKGGKSIGAKMMLELGEEIRQLQHVPFMTLLLGFHSFVVVVVVVVVVRRLGQMTFRS